MERRFGCATIYLLAIALMCGVGIGYAKSPVKKAPGKAAPKKAPVKAAPVVWLTKTAGKITCSVPSNWKRPNGGPAGAIGAYIGADQDRPDGAFACVYMNVPPESSLPGTADKTPAKLSGQDFTQYAINDKSANFQGIVLIADKPEADGTRLMVVAGSALGKWSKYEADLHKMINSVQIKPEPAAAPATPAPDDTKDKQ